MKITASNCEEVRVHTFVAEASELELTPGDYPDTLETNLGNKQPFVLDRLDSQGAVYRQAAGCIVLHVCND